MSQDIGHPDQVRGSFLVMRTGLLPFVRHSCVAALVVSETKGTWGKAEEVPGIAALNTRGPA